MVDAFRPGKTFGLYVSHAKKACQIRNVSISWGDYLLSGVIKGMTRAQGKSGDFPNVVDLRPLRRIINFEGIESQFSTICYLSFLFSLRAPSGGICMK